MYLLESVGGMQSHVHVVTNSRIRVGLTTVRPCYSLESTPFLLGNWTRLRDHVAAAWHGVGAIRVTLEI